MTDWYPIQGAFPLMMIGSEQILLYTLEFILPPLSDELTCFGFAPISQISSSFHTLVQDMSITYDLLRFMYLSIDSSHYPAEWS